MKDTEGWPISFFMTQVSDYTGAAALLADLPEAQWLLADRGYGADWFRKALAVRNITACIPSNRNRKVPIPHALCYIVSATRSKISLAGPRLAAHPHKLRSMRSHIHFRYSHCGNPRLSNQAMSPDLQYASIKKGS